MFGGLFFLSSWPPLLLLKTRTFSFLICFQRLLVCQMRQQEKLQFCLDTKNNGALPLDPACPVVWSPARLPWSTPEKEDFDFFLWYPTHTHQVSQEKSQIISEKPNSQKTGPFAFWNVPPFVDGNFRCKYTRIFLLVGSIRLD